jgi:ATP-dependent RNA/DNA helicase IGHMBP2
MIFFDVKISNMTCLVNHLGNITFTSYLMEAVTQYFAQLKKALAQEKEEDLIQFRKMVTALTPTQRREKGFSWNPAIVKKVGYAIGDRVSIQIYRTQHADKDHRMRPGDNVQVYSTNPSRQGLMKSGVIQHVTKTNMRIILNTRDIPDWIHEAAIGVDLEFDDRTYQEMENAIRIVETAHGNRLAELRDILIGIKKPNDSRISYQELENSTLNSSQKKAVHHIQNTPEVSFIHGPPGTGKTTTLIESVERVLLSENCVLITTPSNAAADLLTERLNKKNINTIRIGNISRIDEDVLEHTLDFIVSRHLDTKQVKKIRIEAAAARKEAERYRRSFGQEERAERKIMYKEAEDLSAWATDLENRIVEKTLDTAQAIVTTLVGSSNRVLEKRKFFTVFIDEAAQALEPACWIPILKASKLVMAGDPFQLPPTIKSHGAKKDGLEITLLEKNLNHPDHTKLLNIQYRMNHAIMGFSNEWFYDGSLSADKSVESHTLIQEQGSPIEWIDTAGCDFAEKNNLETNSKFNPEEYFILREHLLSLDILEREKDFPSIGIISPYREQVLFMQTQVEEDHDLSKLNIDVDTIDSFQGQECDIIYISLVRSNLKSEIGFLKDYRRMNVAMTRARKKLIIIGDTATIAADPFYRKLIEYCEKINGYRSAWEFMNP